MPLNLSCEILNNYYSISSQLLIDLGALLPNYYFRGSFNNKINITIV